MFNSLPARSSYFSINSYIDRSSIAKANIAIDIIRKYMNNLKELGETVRVFSLEGYGERLTIEELLYGCWMVFSYIYGEEGVGYPFNIHIDTSNGVIGWNRDVVHPTIDIAIATKLYDELTAESSSYRDKFSRLETIKKLFYKTDTYEDRFYSDPTETACLYYDYLKEINPVFYSFISDKLDELTELAQNETLSVSMPKGLLYKFDDNTSPNTYDEAKTNKYYVNGLMNLNSVVIKANKFYASFLTSFEQMIYQYTKQKVPLKIYAYIATLFNSYVKLIVEYLKPYHAKLLDTNPNLKMNKSIDDCVNIGDIMANNHLIQLYTDIVKYNFDNIYSPSPETYDKLDRISDDYKISISNSVEDNTNINHNVLDKYLLIADRTNFLMQESTVFKIDTKVTNKNLDDSIEIPLHVYPVSDYEGLKTELLTSTDDTLLDMINLSDNTSLSDMVRYIDASVISKTGTNTYKNVCTHDLVLISDNYCPKGSYMITDIEIVRSETDSYTDSKCKIGLMCEDTLHYMRYNGKRFIKEFIPSLGTIFNSKNQYESYESFFKPFNKCEYFIKGEKNLKYSNHFCNFIKFMVYLPVNSTVKLPTVNFTYRK